ncbi:hypothetical protein BDW74DRAFT_143177 [Aspergillus multicolor]|uniref:uncharacterized protein n=1 Tax=Aspergillus multicolor TaxID=41759 RepID=UPI003CCE52E7
MRSARSQRSVGIALPSCQSRRRDSVRPSRSPAFLLKAESWPLDTPPPLLPHLRIQVALKRRSMIIGADVSHSPQGVWLSSLAAVAVCMDQFGGRYWGACEANGERIEMVARANMEIMLTPLIREWMLTVGDGRAPDNVYYFRDGR